ncbi:MAG TPA: hypothetical protein VMC48_02895 [Methanobacterium sp.]|nr:hypothetical protein [Methanobacterium sp.]
MPFTDAQQLFTLIFSIHFTLIIDRVHRSYNPYDTYNAWKGQSHAVNRLLVNWLIMYVIPLVNFAVYLIGLGIYNITFDPVSLGIVNVVLVGLLSFFDFGYYRIFEAVLYAYPDTFYTAQERDDVLEKERGEVRAHLIPGVAYVVVTMIIFIVLILIN